MHACLHCNLPPALWAEWPRSFPYYYRGGTYAKISAAMACATWNCCRLVHHTTVSLHCKAAYVRCMHVYTVTCHQCKHACTLRMRLCNEVTQLYGVQDGSSFMWHKPWQHCTYTTLANTRLYSLFSEAKDGSSVRALLKEARLEMVPSSRSVRTMLWKSSGACEITEHCWTVNLDNIYEYHHC